MKIIRKALLSIIVSLTVISTPLSSLGAMYLRANSEDEGSTLPQAENHIITKPTPIKDIFPDRALAKIIANEFDKAVTDLVTKAELDTVDLLFSYSSTELIQSLEGVQHLPNLSRINFWYHNVEDLSPLSQLTKLTEINMSGGRIQDLSPLSQLTNLKELGVGRNQIKDITPLRQLTNLTYLSLSGNKIEDITVLSRLTKLLDLDLSENLIQDIAPIIEIPGLYRLAVGGNPLSDIAPLNKISRLLTLDLTHSPLIDLTPISTFTSLSSLSLGMNQLQDLTLITPLTNLTYLELGGNQIQDLSPISTLKKLGSLNLGKNQIQDIAQLSQFPLLYNLELNDNNISNITPLRKLVNLSQLDLSHNQIQDISSLINLAKLAYLQLGDNQIQDISPLSYLRNLQDVKLAQNQIQNIAPLRNLDYLDSLDVSQQKITVNAQYDPKLRVANKIIGVSGDILTPSDISDNGIYDGADISWDLSVEDFSGPNAKTSVSYTWSDRASTGYRDPVFSGTYEIVLSEYVAFMVDGNEYQRNAALHGEYIREPQAPEKEAYDFVGWYTSEAAGHKWNFAQDVMPQKPIQLYARFTPKKYNVIYNNEGQEHVTQVAYQDKLTAPLTPKKEGYTFIGWFSTDEKEWDFNKDTMPSEDVTLYARFAQNTYTLTYVNGEQEQHEVIAYGEKLNEPTVPIKEGHTFSGWFTDPSGGWLWNFVDGGMPAHDLTLYARFRPNLQAVMFDYNDPELAVNNNIIVARFGEKLPRPADPIKEGYTFLGWFQAPAGGIAWDFEHDTMPDKYVILYAQYQLINTTYTVTYNTEGIVMGTDTVRLGELIPEPVPPIKVGHIFFGWYTSETGGTKWNFATDIMPGADLTLYARFIPQRFNVTFVNDRGEAPAMQVIQYGKKIANPGDPIAEGYRFLGWFTDPILGTQWDFENDTIGTNNVTLYARWEAIS